MANVSSAIVRLTGLSEWKNLPKFCYDQIAEARNALKSGMQPDSEKANEVLNRADGAFEVLTNIADDNASALDDEAIGR